MLEIFLLNKVRITVVILTVFALTFAGVPFVLAGDETLPKPKVLGKETIYTSKRLSTYDSIIVKDFPINEAEVSNIGDRERSRYEAAKPKMVNILSEELIRQLKAKKLFKKVQRNKGETAKAIILEGKFTQVNAGSRALKFAVGYGAGSSKITIQGRLLDATTKKELAVFENDRHSPFNLADFERIFMEDTKNQAKDLAEFLGKLY